MQTKATKIGLFDFTLIVISLVIGMGIFRTAVDSAADSNTPTIYFAAWIIGGLVALFGALTYAEIGSRLPVTGGYYKVFTYAYHPSIAFAINCVILVSNAASLAVVALIGAEYLIEALFPNAVSYLKTIIAMVAILVFYLVNLMGLKMSAKTQSVLMIFKILMILVLITGLFFPQHFATETIAPVVVPSTQNNMFISLGLAMVAVSFTYGGYQQTINFGNDVQQPQKNVPKGILYGIVIIIVLYLLVNFSYYKVVGFDWMQNRPKGQQVGTALITKIYGSKAAVAFGALLFICVLSYVNALLLSNPRVMYAMAADQVLPKMFAKTKGEKQILFNGLTTFAILCIVILFFSEKVDELLSFSIFLDCFGMILSAATIFALRKKTKQLDHTGIYKMKLFPIIPILFIAAYSLIAIVLFIKKTNLAYTALIVMACFIGLYFVLQKLKSSTINKSK
jgi:basic amino acid/polyamine antiporter, APA family